MPIEIRELRADMGGDLERWRESQRKRFKDPESVDLVVSLDTVSLQPTTAQSACQTSGV
jgi:hypothetical protein